MGALGYVALLLLYPNVFWFDRLWTAGMVGVVIGVSIAGVAHSLRRDNSLKAIGCAVLGTIAVFLVGVPMARSFRAQERELQTVRDIGSRQITRIVVQRDGALFVEAERGRVLEAMRTALREARIYTPVRTGTWLTL